MRTTYPFALLSPPGHALCRNRTSTCAPKAQKSKSAPAASDSCRTVHASVCRIKYKKPFNVTCESTRRGPPSRELMMKSHVRDVEKKSRLGEPQKKSAEKAGS